MSLAWLREPAARPDAAVRAHAEARQRALTKPRGALGRLETISIHLSALQANPRPRVDRIHIAVYAADHGVAAEGVSAYPQSVTAAMIRNFRQGGAAISVMARQLGASLEVINLGTIDDTRAYIGANDLCLGPGTANFLREPAMREDQLAAALDAGRATIRRAKATGAELYIGGEMGIGNTTATTALACALLDLSPADITGPGTGLDANGVRRKAEIVRQALRMHAPHLRAPLEALRRLGGFEIAALVGSYVASAQHAIPTMVDGFIATCAALVAVRLQPETLPWLLFSHASAEPGHRLLLKALGVTPLLDLAMRLGEGTGAAAAVPLLRMACALHNDMATFDETGVSDIAD